MSSKATIIEINKSRTLRKIKNLETQLSKEHINLDKLKELAWTGIPSSKSHSFNELFCA
jgi:hypothetical protein